MRNSISAFLLLVLAVIALSSCENYGNKVSKDSVEIFYKDSISKENAQQVLDILYPSWNDSAIKKSVQLAKTGDTVYFRMVIDEERAKDVKDEAYFLLANGLSASVFKGAPVNVDLTNNTFETIRTLHFQKVNTPDYGTKYIAGNIEVFANDGCSAEEANALAIFLDGKDGDSDVVKSFQAGKTDGVYVINMVSDQTRSASVPDEEFDELAAGISDNIFKGMPLSLRLTDNTFTPYKTFTYKQ